MKTKCRARSNAKTRGDKMKERNLYLKRKNEEPVRISIKGKKGVVTTMELRGGGPDMDFKSHGCMYIEYAGYTIYIDASMLQHSGEFIMKKWKDQDAGKM